MLDRLMAESKMKNRRSKSKSLIPLLERAYARIIGSNIFHLCTEADICAKDHFSSDSKHAYLGSRIARQRTHRLMD